MIVLLYLFVGLVDLSYPNLTSYYIYIYIYIYDNDEDDEDDKVYYHLS